MSYLGPFPKVSLTDEIAEQERELKMRETVYYAQFRAGKISREEAARRMACTRATLERLKALVPTQTSLF
jgi:hypothetical protein